MKMQKQQLFVVQGPLSGRGPSHCLVLMLPRPPDRQPPELEFLVT